MKFGSAQLLGSLALLLIGIVGSAFSLIDFRTIQFQAGKSTPVSVALVEEAADTLTKHPEIKVRIVGFTDDQECSNARNCNELARRRASMVKEWLLAHGIPSSQVIGVEAKGSDEPIDSNAHESSRQHNRRVEVINTQSE